MLLNLCAVQDSKPRPLDYQGRFIPTAPSTWFRRSFYGMYTNGDDNQRGYQIRARSSCASWNLFCHRFVDIPLYVIICQWQIARPHQNWTKCGFQDNLSGFNSLNRNVRIVACRQWGDSRVWEQINVLKSTLEIKIFCAATLELVYKLTGPPKKCKCFSEISR